jgi:signal transduction histidine kinase
VAVTRAVRRKKIAWPVTVAALAFAAVANALSWSESVSTWWIEVPLRASGVLAIIGGLAIWLRHRAPRIGQLVLAIGATHYLGDLRTSTDPVVFALGFWLAYVYSAVVGHLVLVWPSGHATTRFVRVIVPICYLAAAGTQIVRYYADNPQPPWWYGTTGVNTTWAKLGSLTQVVLVLTVIVFTVVRWTASARLKRRPVPQVGTAFVVAAVLTACAGIASIAGAPKLFELTLIVAAMACGVLGILAGLLIRAMLNQIEQIRTSQLRIVTAALEERRRIQSDLHDGAQQKLFAVLGWLDAAKHALITTDGHDSAKHAVDRAHSQLKDAIKTVRELTQGIYPAALVEHGLAPAVEGLADISRIPVSFDIPSRRWPEHVEAGAYFVVAEAMANTYKHAGATRVDIKVQSKSDRVLVDVADDGRGGADIRTGTGLRGLQDRVAAVGGKLTITSVPGRGTRISAIIPLETS